MRWLLVFLLLASPAFADSTNSQAVQGQSQDLTIKSADPIRNIQISPNVPVTMRGGPSYFGAPPIDTGPMFIPLRQLIPILNAAEITEDMEDDDVEVEVEVFKSLEYSADRVRFSIASSMDISDPLAIISVRADDLTATSAKLAVKLSNLARSVGGSRVVFLKEGVTKRLHSTGWGVGINNNISVVNADPTGIGGVASGGTGYSAGDAEYLSLPYVIAVICR